MQHLIEMKTITISPWTFCNQGFVTS